jgi:hypothetical protein
MESNKQKRNNLLNNMPIDNRATPPIKMRNYGKPTSPVAMRMASTKATLPMTKTPLLNVDKEKPTSEPKEDPRFSYDKYGNQIGIRDNKTNGYFTPTEKGFQASRAKYEKIGRAPREFKGKLFTRDGGTARGYQTEGGEFLRPSNDREWVKMQAQYNKDKREYDQDESLRAEFRGQILDYNGKTTKNKVQ